MFPKIIRIFFVALVLITGCLGAFAFSNANEIALPALPQPAQRTYALIQRGGPFPYEKDGATFGNYERQLPQQKRGYYREFTVKTSASRNRGAIRIVCGGLKNKPFDACYYTDNHYATFKKIAP